MAVSEPTTPEPAAQVLLLKRDLTAVVMALRGVCALTGDECLKENAEAWERADRALKEYERGRESFRVSREAMLGGCWDGEE